MPIEKAANTFVKRSKFLFQFRKWLKGNNKNVKWDIISFIIFPNA